jgi:hypothetical protein
MTEDTKWLESDDIRPYVYMRKENLFAQPGRRSLDWFKHEPIYRNPLVMGDVGFADQILHLEGKAFAKADLKMPRWVFYDCAIMPGFVCGFAYKTSKLPAAWRTALEPNDELEWTPISLFIIIPSLQPGEWVAHNLCTANSLLPEAESLYALGFLSKAFGLWYANVEVLCGMTQWLSPAIRLHSNYGAFEILTAYTPVHSYARTLTYRSRINLDYWPAFFKQTEKQTEIVQTDYEYSGFVVDPKDDESLKSLQRRIESGEGPFFFKPAEIRTQPLDMALKVYRLASLRSDA